MSRATSNPTAVDLADLRERLTHRCGLLDKREVLAIIGVSHVSLWHWMRSGRFPRCYTVGRGSNSKSVWRAEEVAQWLDDLKLRPLKGDAVTDQTTIEAA